MCVRKLCKIVESYPVATSGVEAGFHSVNTCTVFILSCVFCPASVLHYRCGLGAVNLTFPKPVWSALEVRGISIPPA